MSQKHKGTKGKLSLNIVQISNLKAFKPNSKPKSSLRYALVYHTVCNRGKQILKTAKKSIPKKKKNTYERAR